MAFIVYYCKCLVLVFTEKRRVVSLTPSQEGTTVWGTFKCKTEVQFRLPFSEKDIVAVILQNLKLGPNSKLQIGNLTFVGPMTLDLPLVIFVDSEATFVLSSTDPARENTICFMFYCISKLIHSRHIACHSENPFIV